MGMVNFRDKHPGYKIQFSYPHMNMENLSSLSYSKHLGLYFILKRHLMSFDPSVVYSSTSHVCSWGTIIRAIFLGR